MHYLGFYNLDFTISEFLLHFLPIKRFQKRLIRYIHALFSIDCI